jgi:DNA-binding response OmpR family regulator
MARVRSQLRRYTKLGGSKTEKSDSYIIGNIELNDNSKQVIVDGEIISLTPTEFEILKLLMQNSGTVLSPSEIYRRVWNDEAYGGEGTVAVHIRHIREKIEINPAEPRYLKVVWAHGYKMEKDGAK